MPPHGMRGGEGGVRNARHSSAHQSKTGLVSGYVDNHLAVISAEPQVFLFFFF